MRNSQTLFGNADEHQDGFSSETIDLQEPATHCSKGGNVHFLPVKNPVPNTEGTAESIQLENTDEHLNDIKTMSATQLGKKYKLTYSSWKNMKQRCKNDGYILDIRFEMFADFLKHMGPRTHKKFTIDRIDSESLNYGPGNCRWADKHTQNRNKGNNVHLTFKGETLPVSVWAIKTGQNADTLYKRIAKGWSDEEVVTGVKAHPKSLVVKQVSITRLSIGDLDKHLYNTIKLLHSFKEDMECLYNLNGPESLLPTDVAAKYATVQKDYLRLFNEMKRRYPDFNVVDHFYMLFA